MTLKRTLIEDIVQYECPEPGFRSGFVWSPPEECNDPYATFSSVIHGRNDCSMSALYLIAFRWTIARSGPF